MFRVLIVFAVALAALFMLQQAIAADMVGADALQSLHVPSELWYVIAGGAVQGLIWYGAVNAKITSLTERITQIENRAAEDRRNNERRANLDRDAQNNHYTELLRVFIDSLQRQERGNK